MSSCPYCNHDEVVYAEYDLDGVKGVCTSCGKQFVVSGGVSENRSEEPGLALARIRANISFWIIAWFIGTLVSLFDPPEFFPSLKLMLSFTLILGPVLFFFSCAIKEQIIFEIVAFPLRVILRAFQSSKRR